MIITSVSAEKSDGIRIGIHTSEISIHDNQIARNIFLSLPVKSQEASSVFGLIFRNDRYIFCVREPDRTCHCHIYLDGRGNGQLNSYWSDYDYGQGSMAEFIATDPKVEKSSVDLKSDLLKIYTEGKVAKVLYEKMDLISTTIHKEDSLVYEKKTGKKMQCVKIQQEKNDFYACRVFVPIGGDKKLELKDLS